MSAEAICISETFASGAAFTLLFAFGAFVLGFAIGDQDVDDSAQEGENA